MIANVSLINNFQVQYMKFVMSSLAIMLHVATMSKGLKITKGEEYNDADITIIIIIIIIVMIMVIIFPAIITRIMTNQDNHEDDKPWNLKVETCKEREENCSHKGNSRF